MHSTEVGAKSKSVKNSGLNRIRTHDLCDAGAVLYQLSDHTNREQLLLLLFFFFFCEFIIYP